MIVGAAVDRAKCVPWVGRNLLAALDSHYRSPRPTAEFLDVWRDALPESWRGDAQLEAIKVRYFHYTRRCKVAHACQQGDYTLPSDHTIASKSAAALPSVAPGKAAAKGPRKWHEKLKASRRQ